MSHGLPLQPGAQGPQEQSLQSEHELSLELPRTRLTPVPPNPGCSPSRKHNAIKIMPNYAFFLTAHINSSISTPNGVFRLLQ